MHHLEDLRTVPACTSIAHPCIYIHTCHLEDQCCQLHPNLCICMTYTCIHMHHLEDLGLDDFAFDLADHFAVHGHL